jgi:hypothetical protein
MGTRCLTLVHNESGEVLINLYRQYDGYPEGHGKELKEFLGKKLVVNGLPALRDEKGFPLFNGMPCLAAALVAHFKTMPGCFYLQPPSQRDIGEEFIYHVRFNGYDQPALIEVTDDPSNGIDEPAFTTLHGSNPHSDDY